MPKCPSCGRQIPKGSTLCPNCGYDIINGYSIVDVSWKVDRKKFPKRFITIIFIIFIASLLTFIWTAPRIEGSSDAPILLVVLCIGSLISVFYTGVIVFSYVTRIPISEGSSG